MNLFIKRHKFLSISFLVIIFLIPILSFANSQFSGWRVPAYQTLKGVIYTNPSGAAAIPMVAITNTSSSNDYFVPTKTWNEYSAFIVHKLTVLSVNDYCGGGVCEVPETCGTCPQDCCAVCTTFVYSAWSGCSNNVETRQIIAQGPYGCAGGTPVTTQPCCDNTGCDTGYWCASGLTYYSSLNCAGASSPYGPACVPTNGASLGCNNMSYASLYLYYTAPNLCTHTCTPPAPTSGCASGYFCGSYYTYYNSLNCSGYSGTLQTSCILNGSASLGCNNYTYASVYLTSNTATGCTH